MGLCWNLFICEWMRKEIHHDMVPDRNEVESSKVRSIFSETIAFDGVAVWDGSLPFSLETTLSDKATPGTNPSIIVCCINVDASSSCGLLFGDFLKIENRPALETRPRRTELETMALHYGTAALSFGIICILKRGPYILRRSVYAVSSILGVSWRDSGMGVSALSWMALFLL